nr:DUF547 domain-containing protein [Acanthopleuribacter pedis]
MHVDERPFLKPDPRLWDVFLKEVVTDGGLVDYQRAAGPARQHLNAYLAEVARATPAQFPDEAARLAFLINAYNAFVIQGVLQHRPIQSVEDAGPLRQFFRERAYLLAGRKVSLHGLETTLIQPLDARVHFALNCAARSCPPLRAEAYVPDRLEAQLSEAETAFINNERYNHYDPEEKVWRLSSIFKWYLADFGGEQGLRNLLQARGPRGTVVEAPITYLPYDWSLNDSRRGPLPAIQSDSAD